MSKTINIHSNFTGGNVRVKEMDGNTVIIENELRDTTEDWFYWAFCIEGAQGRELTFRVERPARLGYWGPAVSHDLKEWHWLDCCDGNSFTYHFAENESKVFFAHHMLYHPDRFASLCEELHLDVSELCKSRKGRSVPCLRIGKGEKSIIITARHHACESTGSYVMEGILRHLARSPIENARILVVPFVDYDGVVDGDQGKSRAPHDHNRDYIDEPIYSEIRAIQEHRNTYGCNYGFDLHSPWHQRGVNDKIFIVRNLVEKQKEFDVFSSLLESEITESSMKYSGKDDFQPLTDWNKPGPCFGYTTTIRPECKLAFTIESTYAGTADNKVSGEKLVELGRCYAKTIKRYIEVTNENA